MTADKKSGGCGCILFPSHTGVIQEAVVEKRDLGTVLWEVTESLLVSG